MTGVVRLTLVSHGMTDAMADGRFPADEPLNELGRRQVQAIAAQFGSAASYFVAPELRTRQTAGLLGCDGAPEPLLADLDCGRWRGRALQTVDEADLAAWLSDPAGAPHGGESIADLIERASRWLNALTANPLHTAAVTHPAVIRAALLAALDADPASFWRVDVAPAACVVMHHRGGRWTLRL
ncbi:histidine phosphatase family protein [Mycobacterium avium]|uniref:histidine phosphatase family protein n=1 Tax=Mycobacterium avium TaxID=1764 RepID=UPI0003D206CA|nr:histidine phosphatase family protein [Mycobacterium avium]ETB26752.1 histidine phosphatase [Mycobacterium avium subsp. hominissuis 10-4249]KDO98274.1 histidine phosphatase [Mycobacterium avium subsp. hominissuis A5]